MSMSKYVLDASAWIEYLEGTARGNVVEKLLINRECELFITPITIAEVTSVVLRKMLNVEMALQAMSSAKLVDLDREFAKKVGMMHIEMRKTVRKFSLSDAAVLVAARLLNAKIITGDEDFRHVKEAVLI